MLDHVPAAHAMQSVRADAGNELEYVPAAHATHDALPAVAYVPALHVTQTTADVA